MLVLEKSVDGGAEPSQGSMRLAEALKILQKAPGPTTGAFHVFLVCGCTPLHLHTFLRAHLHLLFPDGRVTVDTGLYGDCLGSLDRARKDSPAAIAVALEWADFDPRLGIRRLGGWSPRQLADIVATISAQMDRFQQAIERAAAVAPLGICLPTLPLPPISHKPGWEASLFELTLRHSLGAFSCRIAELPSVRVVSPQRLDARSPFAERLDVKAELMSGFPYRTAHASIMAELLAQLLKPASPKKGLITDLDDTLWRGILGEVGVNGVTWDLDHHSHMHGLYQQFVQSLAEAGILVGVASKNDPTRVADALQREDLVIAQDRLFPVKVHWGRKSESVGDILRAWNIGADSVVFIDDSPMELAEVKAVYPAIECLAFPVEDDHAVYALLEHLRDLFGKSQISAEDGIRLESLRNAAVLAADRAAHEGTPDGFLAAADAEIIVSFAKEPPDPRALELVNKTNQFNLNGRRYTESAWRAFLRNPETFLIVVAYTDKYGRLGKIAALGGRCQGSSVFLDTWVMSCRAFARRIEHRCLELLFDRFGAERIVLDFEPTERNQPFQEFLKQFQDVANGRPAGLSRNAFLQQCPQLFHKVKMVHDE
jgi:FkbH-like protein